MPNSLSTCLNTINPWSAPNFPPISAFMSFLVGVAASKLTSAFISFLSNSLFSFWLFICNFISSPFLPYSLDLPSPHGLYYFQFFPSCKVGQYLCRNINIIHFIGLNIHYLCSGSAHRHYLRVLSLYYRYFNIRISW